MDDDRRPPSTLMALPLVALAHALLTWPLREVLALFLGGAVLAFAAEVEVDLWSYPEARSSGPGFGGSRGGTSPGGR